MIRKAVSYSLPFFSNQNKTPKKDQSCFGCQLSLLNLHPRTNLQCKGFKERVQVVLTFLSKVCVCDVFRDHLMLFIQHMYDFLNRSNSPPKFASNDRQSHFIEWKGNMKEEGGMKQKKSLICKANVNNHNTTSLLEESANNCNKTGHEE